MISSALGDTAATSTVPPVIEAQGSDLRDTTSPLALPTEPHLEPPQATNTEPELELPVHSMDGAIETPDAQIVPVDHGDTDLTSFFSDETPALDAAPHQIPEPSVNHDADMTDVPAPFTKVPREREDDDDDEPSAKRTKTEEDTKEIEGDTTMADLPAQDEVTPEVPAVSEAVAIPERPAAPQIDEAAPADSEGTSTITPYETREIIKILKNVARTKIGLNFKRPVIELWPAVKEGYLEKVSHPVDLPTMEDKLKQQKYPTLEDFRTEVNLIYENALAYNGDAHEVTKLGKLAREAILTKMDAIPPEPVAGAKAAKKQRKSTPLSEPALRTPAPRRQSKSTGAAPATFALDPNTSTPLIRRDSTNIEGGRPKREIHPPKKDLPYSSTRPKNKKAAQEIKFCEEVLAELKKPKHSPYVAPFMTPVDPVALHIPHYFNVIKHPMDISKIELGIKSGEITGAKDFERDMKLMLSNCFKFNPAGNPVHILGKQLETAFNETWANKSRWLADHAPAPQTPSSNGDPDDEESEEEIEVEDTAATSAITVLTERLNEEQEKLIALLPNPKKNAQMIEMQRDLIEMLKAKLNSAKAKPSTTKKIVKKPKAAKPVKKQAPAKKKAGPTAAKKAGGRQKYLGTQEKNIISIGITRLPDHIAKEILAMIKSETEVDVRSPNHSTLTELTNYQEGTDGEVELDIDVVSQPSLWKIYNYVLEYAPDAVDEARAMLDDKDDEPPTKLAKPPAKKKNKPMSKNEQEAKIEQLEGTLKNFETRASGSQEPMPSMPNPLFSHEHANTIQLSKIHKINPLPLMRAVVMSPIPRRIKFA